MALFIQNQGKRSELQEKLAAELREKMAKQAADDGDKSYKAAEELPDYVEDSAYVQSYKKSKPIPRQVVVLIVLVAVAIACGLVIVLAGQ